MIPSVIASRVASATVLLTLGLGGLGVGTASAASSTARQASVNITVPPTAAETLKAGNTFTSTFTITNKGDVTANDAELELTYDSSLLAVQDVRFDSGSAMVTGTGSNSFEAALGDIGAKDGSVSVSATFVTLSAYQTGTPQLVNVDVSWKDGTATERRHTIVDAKLLLAGNGPASTAASTVSNNAVNIQGTGFTANQAVVFWYNLPNGDVKPLYIDDGKLTTDRTHDARRGSEDIDVENSTKVYADENGTISITFPLSGLAAGSYSIVAHDLTSGLNLVIPFTK